MKKIVRFLLNHFQGKHCHYDYGLDFLDLGQASRDSVAVKPWSVIGEKKQYFWDVRVRVGDSRVAGAPFEKTGSVIATNAEAAKNEALDARHPNGRQRMRDINAFVVSIFCRGEVDRPIFLGWIH